MAHWLSMEQTCSNRLECWCGVVFSNGSWFNKEWLMRKSLQWRPYQGFRSNSEVCIALQSQTVKNYERAFSKKWSELKTVSHWDDSIIILWGQSGRGKAGRPLRRTTNILGMWKKGTYRLYNTAVLLHHNSHDLFESIFEKKVGLHLCFWWLMTVFRTRVLLWAYLVRM